MTSSGAFSKKENIVKVYKISTEYCYMMNICIMIIEHQKGIKTSYEPMMTCFVIHKMGH